MKKIKFILVTIVLMTNFIIEAEIFQIEIPNFDSGYYYSDFSAKDEKERESVLKQIEKTANNENQGVFLYNERKIDLNNWEFIIYCNQIARNDIEKKTKIKSGKYNSLMFGNTEVIYKDLIEASSYENRYITSIGFTNEQSEVKELYIRLKDKVEVSEPILFNGSSNRHMVYFVWSMLALLMIVLTAISVFFSKKEITLRISFGEDVWKIIIKNCIVELTLYLVFYVLLRFSLFQFLTGQFMGFESFFIYSAGLICSCCIYISYAFFEVKAAFANAAKKKGMLNLLYGIKIVMTCITMTGTIFGLNFIVNNTNLIAKDPYIAIFEKYKYLVIDDFYSVAKECTLDEEDYRFGEERPAIFQEIYEKYYEKAEPIVCSNFLEDTSDYILINKNGEELIKQFIDINDYNEDVLVFVPKNEDVKQVEENVVEHLDNIIDSKNLYSKKLIIYTENKNFTSIYRSENSGADITRNPVLVYIQNEKISKELNIESYNCHMLYNLLDKQVEQIIMEYNLEERGYHLIAPNFIDNYNYYNSFLKKILGFASSFVVLLIILLVFLIILINTIEYQINAVELALKKVVGYSVIEKNIRYIFLCSLLDITIGLEYLAFYSINHIYTVMNSIIFVTGFIVLTELIICILNIGRIEKKSIVKILKGGCL